MTQNFHTPLPTDAPALYSSLNTISSDLDAGITDTLTGDNAFTQLNFDTAEALTISSGAITVSKSIATVDTESAAATDELDTISGGVANDVLLLKAVNASHVVTVKHNTGNIYLADELDIVLDDVRQVLPLVYDGTKWIEVGIFKGRQRPFFRVTKTSAQTINQAATTTLTWETEAYDVGGFFDLANNQFLPTLPGIYMITASAVMVTPTDQQSIILVLNRGGVEIQHKLFRTSGTNNQTVDFSVPIYLNGSESVLIAFFHTGGAATLDVSADTKYSVFTGVLLAAM